jgi:hypothetical protein
VVNKYDDAVRALCAVGLTDLCGWLGVEAGGDAEPLRLSESAPPTTTRQIDLLVELAAGAVLHIEFQKSIERRFAERMLDYWSRIDASLDRPGLVIVQHVVQLGDGRLPSRLSRGRLDFSFQVNRLCDEDPERFLSAVGLVPFAALGQAPERLRPAVFARPCRSWLRSRTRTGVRPCPEPRWTSPPADSTPLPSGRPTRSTPCPFLLRTPRSSKLVS